MSSATRFLHINESLPLKKGGVLPSYTLAYETWGIQEKDDILEQDGNEGNLNGYDIGGK